LRPNHGHETTLAVCRQCTECEAGKYVNDGLCSDCSTPVCTMTQVLVPCSQYQDAYCKELGNPHYYYSDGTGPYNRTSEVQGQGRWNDHISCENRRGANNRIFVDIRDAETCKQVAEFQYQTRVWRVWDTTSRNEYGATQGRGAGCCAREQLAPNAEITRNDRGYLERGNYGFYEGDRQKYFWMPLEQCGRTIEGGSSEDLQQQRFSGQYAASAARAWQRSWSRVCKAVPFKKADKYDNGDSKSCFDPEAHGRWTYNPTMANHTGYGIGNDIWVTVKDAAKCKNLFDHMPGTGNWFGPETGTEGCCQYWKEPRAGTEQSYQYYKNAIQTPSGYKFDPDCVTESTPEIHRQNVCERVPYKLAPKTSNCFDPRGRFTGINETESQHILTDVQSLDECQALVEGFGGRFLASTPSTGTQRGCCVYVRPARAAYGEATASSNEYKWEPDCGDSNWVPADTNYHQAAQYYNIYMPGPDSWGSAYQRICREVPYKMAGWRSEGNTYERSGQYYDSRGRVVWTGRYINARRWSELCFDPLFTNKTGDLTAPWVAKQETVTLYQGSRPKTVNTLDIAAPHDIYMDVDNAEECSRLVQAMGGDYIGPTSASLTWGCCMYDSDNDQYKWNVKCRDTQGGKRICKKSKYKLATVGKSAWSSPSRGYAKDCPPDYEPVTDATTCRNIVSGFDGPWVGTAYADQDDTDNIQDNEMHRPGKFNEAETSRAGCCLYDLTRKNYYFSTSNVVCGEHNTLWGNMRICKQKEGRTKLGRSTGASEMGYATDEWDPIGDLDPSETGIARSVNDDEPAKGEDEPGFLMRHVEKLLSWLGYR